MNENVYLTANHVCARYGVTSMTLWRWLQKEDLDFPKPTYINKRRYFKVDELEDWECRRAAR